MNQNLPDFAKLLSEEIIKATRVILFLHKSPDLDSIGSNIGFLNFVYNYDSKKEVVILSKDEPSTSRLLKIREVTDGLLNIIDPQNYEFKTGDLAVFIDFPDISRTTNNKEFTLPSFVSKAVIDHHVPQGELSKMEYVSTSNLSASSIVYELIQNNSIELKKEYFEFILIGMLGDSGFLKFRDQKFIQSLGIIQKYCEMFGNDNYFKVIDYLEQNKPLEEYNLQKIYLNNLIFKNNFAYTSMTAEERDKMGVAHNFSETTTGAGLIRNIEKTKFVFSVTQDILDKNLYNISFRSCAGSNFVVREIAQKLGGGGHPAAAGAQIEAEDMTNAINLVLSAVNELNGFWN